MKNLKFKALFLLLALTLQGCIIGNKVQVDEKPVGLEGYYNTAPQDLKFCTPAHCSAATADLTPTEISDIMTNPMIYLPQPDQGTAYLIDKTGKTSAFGVYTSKDSLTFHVISSKTGAGWVTGTCDLRTDFEISEGSISVTNAKPKVPTDIRGRLSAKFEMTRTFEGDCTTALSEMQACYLNVVDCPVTIQYSKQELHNYVTDHFQAFIDAGTMTATDISTTTTLNYQVSYF